MQVAEIINPAAKKIGKRRPVPGTRGIRKKIISGSRNVKKILHPDGIKRFAVAVIKRKLDLMTLPGQKPERFLIMGDVRIIPHHEKDFHGRKPPAPGRLDAFLDFHRTIPRKRFTIFPEYQKEAQNKCSARHRLRWPRVRDSGDARR